MHENVDCLSRYLPTQTNNSQDGLISNRVNHEYMDGSKTLHLSQIKCDLTVNLYQKSNANKHNFFKLEFFVIQS